MLELATWTDREAINVLAQEVHAMHIAWRPDIYAAAEEMYPETRFAEATKMRQLYAAKIDNSVAGYVLVKIRECDWPGMVSRRIMLIDELCVDKICRRQGIGTQIMMEVRALAKAFGCTDLQLSVYPQNDEAVAFYQKCGLTIQNITMQCSI